VDHSARVSMKSKANFAKFCELQDALIIDFSNAHAAIAFTGYCYVCQRVGGKTIITMSLFDAADGLQGLSSSSC